MVPVRFLCALTVLILVNVASVNSGIGLSPWQFFLGNRDDLEKVVTIAFQPDEGVKLRQKFEKKYGVRGEKLISSFGEGLDASASVTQ